MFIVICELSLSKLKMLKICTRGWECVFRERGVFWVLFLIKKCVRVTFKREVGYEVVTEGSIGG